MFHFFAHCRARGIVLGHLQDSLVGLGTTGKVISSGPNDRVFVYFADHGAPGEACA